MLSPKITKALWLAGAQASTALTKYQCFVLLPPSVASLTRFPACIHEVVRLPGWPVMLLPDWPGCEYKETAMLDWGAILKSMGSV